MKSKFLLFVILTTFIQGQLFSQTKEKKIGVSISAIKNEYSGDYGNGTLMFSGRNYLGAGLSIAAYYDRSFDFGLQSSYGDYGYRENNVNYFYGRKFDLSLFGHYKLNNGYIFSTNSAFSPFLSLGAGVASYGISPTDKGTYHTIVTKGVDFIVPVGLGLKWQINKLFAVQYQYQYNFTSRDIRDENRGVGFFGSAKHPASVSGTDGFGQHSLSFVVNLIKSNEERQKKIIIKKVEVPQKLNFQLDSNGYPTDSDNDGIPDYKDKCNNTPSGVKVNADGCPLDTDNDGIADNLDKCPCEAGSSNNMGCPENKEKPTSVLTQEKASNNVTPQNNISSTDQKIKPTTYTFNNVLFNPGKFDLNESAINELNQIISVLKSNATYNLEISGYTDNEWSESRNLVLSQKRANAAKNYLVLKGVESNRITAKGYGEKIPLLPNISHKNRAHNRRIEFILIY